MKTTFTLITLLIGFTISAQTDKRLKGIDKDLNRILEETHAVGFSVAVVEKDKVIYAKGFGYSDLENQIVADENTLYAIGSCTKAFTSSILGLLRDENKLSFDDNPRKYLPELEFYNDELNNNVIIKDLMAHRTGIPRHDLSWYFFPADSREEYIKRLKYQEPFTGLRQQWYYNNFMFMLQGAIAESVTGMTWEENVRQRLFGPLEMKRSNLNIDELLKEKNVAKGYSLVDNKPVLEDYYRIGGMAPAGSINSSVMEMANWVITWINNGKFKGKQILPETYVQEAISSQMVAGGGLPDNEFPGMHIDNYGYAWGIYSHNGHYQVQHGGAIDGFRASTSFFPSDSIGIIVLTNQAGAPVTGLVRKTISDRMLKTERTDWIDLYLKEKQEMEEAIKKVKESEIPSTKPKSAHEPGDFIGSYSNPGYGTFTITLENDSLFANFALIQLYLENRHYDVFDVYEVVDGSVKKDDGSFVNFNFTTDNTGDIDGMKVKLEPALDHDIDFDRSALALDVEGDLMKAYTGEYELAGVTIKVYLKNETLYLFVAGQPEYALTPTGKHTFDFKDLKGYKVEFLEAKDASIQEVKLIQPNGTFVAKKK